MYSTHTTRVTGRPPGSTGTLRDEVVEHWGHRRPLFKPKISQEAPTFGPAASRLLNEGARYEVEVLIELQLSVCFGGTTVG